MENKRNGGVFTVTGDGTIPVRLAVDSTSLKQHNMRKWIRHKWKIRRGFVKLHVMVDVDTKKILAVQVIDDRAGDSPMLVPLLDEVLEVVTRTGQVQDSGAELTDARCYLYGDVAYASRDNVTACRDRGVNSCIKLWGKFNGAWERYRRCVRNGSQGTAWGICRQPCVEDVK